MELLQRVRSFDAEQHTVEELVLLSGLCGLMTSKYQTLGLETPEWLHDSQTAIDKAAESRVRDQMEKELRETEARMEALKSADEKRSELKEKQARLKAKLGRT